MLTYEVNKNQAVSSKANSAYQFGLVDKQEQGKLLVVGEHGMSATDHLVDLNYKYLQVRSVDEAFKFLDKTSNYPGELPTAIVCDSKLDDGDAFQLHKLMQGNHFTSVIPFIIIAKEHNEELIKRARESGVDDVYNGTFSAENLHSRLTFLKQFKKEKRKFNVSNDVVFENRTSMLKRMVDVVIATTALLIISPILLLVALIIKLESRGPIIYTSKRVGTGYNIFDLYKFRSMRQGADVELKKLAHLNQYKEGNNAFFKLDNDPRVTTFGKFIRASSIDEIPQLLNVIKGDMSLVGNRPLPLYEAEQLTRDVWAKRFLAPAGLTGLWQVSRRGGEEMSVAERVILDNTYAECHSFWLDLKIILKTFPALISKIHS